jgi:hypothetical protein
MNEKYIFVFRSNDILKYDTKVSLLMVGTVIIIL